MAIAQLSDVGISFGGQAVLSDVSLQIQEAERIGLVGPNGSGKTTLLRILAGTVAPDVGSVQRTRRLRIGFLEQEPNLPRDANVHDAALSAFSDLLDLEQEMRRMEHDIAAADADARKDLLTRFGRLQDRFEHAGGYERENRTGAVLMGLGFTSEQFTRPVAVLSGGEQSRLALARLLLREPDLLLLDEPTNHLDLAGIEWLEGFLGRRYKGAVLLVSHDRTFLDRTVTRIFDLERGRVTAWPGNYSRHLALKEKARLEQRRRHDRQQEFVEKEEGYIRRYHAGQRSKEARGRKKRLERLERIDAPTTEKEISLRFEEERASGEVCLRVEGLSKSFGESALFEELAFEVYRGDRVGIIGPNGSGKTTLLRILLGREPPDRGVAETGHHIAHGYLPQDAGGSVSERTVLDEVWERRRRLKEIDIRNVLGRFLFSGDDAVNKRLCDLSGGERTRVALAGLMIERPNVLVLDEPTNHLDIPSRVALEAALLEYGGTIIAVSHDRYFLDRIVQKLIVLDEGRGRVFLGNYEAYAERKAAETQAAEKSVSAKPRAATTRKARPRLSKNRLAQLEKQIAQLEKEKGDLEATLADPALYADVQRAREAPRQYQDVCAQIETLYREWTGQEAPDAP